MEQNRMGRFLALLRKSAGMTQRELAGRLLVSDKTVSRWERGESAPDLDLIPVLAELFGVTADELLRGERGAAPVEDARRERELRRLLAHAGTRLRIRSMVSVTAALLGFAASVGCVYAFTFGHGVDRHALAITVSVLFSIFALAHQAICTAESFAVLRRMDEDALSLAPEDAAALENTLLRTTGAAFGLISVLFVLSLTIIALGGDIVEVLILGTLWCSLTALACFLVCCAVRRRLRRTGK